VSATTVRTWNPGTAAVLSFLIPGLGHVYKGHIAQGLLFFVVTIIGYLMLIVPGLIVHVCVIVDAYNGRSKEEATAARAHAAATVTPEQRARMRQLNAKAMKVALASLGALVILGVVGGTIASRFDEPRKAAPLGLTDLVCSQTAKTPLVFKAMYHPESSTQYPTIVLTFSGTRKPSSAEATAAASYCLEVAQSAYSLPSNVQLSAAYRDADDRVTTIPLVMQSSNAR